MHMTGLIQTPINDIQNEKTPKPSGVAAPLCHWKCFGVAGYLCRVGSTSKGPLGSLCPFGSAERGQVGSPGHLRCPQTPVF